MMIFSIVVTYNGSKWVEKCFGSLTNAEIQDHTIIAIDNGSSDSTLEKIRNNFPSVKVIETGENLGFGKANNIGMKMALDNNADFVLLLNQDAWLEENAINRLIQVANKNPEYGIVSPLHFSGYGEIDRNYLNNILPDKCSGLIHDAFRNELKDIYSVDFINAAVWLINTSCLKTVGLFEPLFNHYGEDENYVARCHYHQYKIGVVPASSAIHDRNQQKKTYKTYRSVKDLLVVSKIKILLQINLSKKQVIKAYLRNTIFKTGAYFSVYIIPAQIISEIYILMHLHKILNARKYSKNKYFKE
ncbi:glycosyltransferase family 2 protein [Saccharicrinis sp. FJH2]|uniref:glycosyltransferase family 2 protein n=1 Tax=Saccharicrinis sp. FJH65 TaxID=3344659 RepID=UPI0035F4DC94